jgi:STE24 endopeptidase
MEDRVNLRRLAVTAFAAFALLVVVGTVAARALEASPPAAADAPPTLVDNPLGPVPADEPRNEAYAHSGYALYVVNTLFSFALLAVILATGLSAWLQRLTERVTGRPSLQVAMYVVLFTLVGFVAGLPLEIYGGFMREKKYGFMNQTFGAWMGDQGKALIVSVVLQAIFFPLLYIVIRRLGRGWWVPGAVLAIAFIVLGQVIAPVFIAPLFNTFTPLHDETLRQEILDLAHAQGIPAGEVYQVDASRQSEHTNAYVAGLLGTQRIVMYDTILKRFTPREIRFVMGHEMGHYVLNHIWKTVAFLSVLILAGLWFVDVTARRIIRARPGWGIGGFEQPASLPLLLLLLSLVFLAAQPVISTYSRWQEHASDRFGLEVVRDPEAAASAFRKFAIYDLSEINVNPVIETVMFSHPSVGNRIRYAQEWAAANGVAAPGGEAAAPGGGAGDAH